MHEPVGAAVQLLIFVAVLDATMLFVLLEDVEPDNISCPLILMLVILAVLLLLNLIVAVAAVAVDEVMPPAEHVVATSTTPLKFMT